MNEVFKNIRKNNGTSQILFSWDWHNNGTLHCNGFNSLGRTTTFEFSFLQHSIPILWHFSLRSLPTLPFSECVFFWYFSLRSLPTLPFSECVFFWHFSLRSLPFSEGFADFRYPKEYALMCQQKQLMLLSYRICPCSIGGLIHKIK